MKHIAPCVEQLDLASKNLSQGDPIKSRISLILSDNIVELMSHKMCANLIKWGRLKSNNGKDFTEKDRQNALGQQFNKKIHFLQNEGKIGEKEALFCIEAHRFRNEAYHVGVLHDDFIFELAWYYHELACHLFSKLKPDFYMCSSAEFSQAVLSHVDPKNCSNLKKITDSLLESRPKIARTLGNALSTSLRSRLSRLAEDLDYLEHEITKDPEQKYVDKLEVGYSLFDLKLFKMCQKKAEKLEREVCGAAALREFRVTLELFEEMEMEIRQVVYFHAGYMDYLANSYKH